jgi:CRISPR-associated protein Csx17
VIAGDVDLARVSALARAFMAVRWDRWNPTPRQRSTPRAHLARIQPSEAWTALRLTFLPWPLAANRTIPADEAIIRRLMSGDGSAAVDIALRRLRASGLRPPIRGAITNAATTRLWTAALVFPISHYRASELARSFEPPSR